MIAQTLPLRDPITDPDEARNAYADAIARADQYASEPETYLQLSALCAVEPIAAADRAAGRWTHPLELPLAVGDAIGHPRTTTHPATYGYCELESAHAAVLRLYRAARA